MFLFFNNDVVVFNFNFNFFFNKKMILTSLFAHVSVVGSGSFEFVCLFSLFNFISHFNIISHCGIVYSIYYYG
jgi:hypothetical protein